LRAGRNLFLSAVLHLALIAVFAGGAFRGASGISPVNFITVYLSAGPANSARQEAAGPKLKSTIVSLPVKTESPPVPSSPRSDRTHQGADTSPVSVGGGNAVGYSNQQDPGITGNRQAGNTGNPSLKTGSTRVEQAPAQGITEQGAKPAPDEITRKIRDSIYGAKYYPTTARRRGIEGTVTVEFTVNNSGYPENLRITRSSGYEVLDSAALGTVSKAAPFPLLRGRLEVPITFRLQESK